MFTANSDSMIKETLKNLCSTDGLCYGIFWGFDQTDSNLLLTLKDAYIGEEMGTLMDNVLLQVHVLGEGVIGQVAFSESNQWMFSDSYQGSQNSLGSVQSLQDESEFYRQFCMGIKTIALISVEQWGVVQLGSTEKLHQNNDFTQQVKELFKRIQISQNLELLPSEVYGSVNQNFQPISDFENFPVFDGSSIFPSQSLSSSLDYHNTNSLYAPSILIDDHIPIDNKPFDFDFANFFDCSSGLFELFSPLQASSNDLLNATGLSPVTNLSGNVNPPVDFSKNLPTNSVQSSVTFAFGASSNCDEKRSATCALDNQLKYFGDVIKCEQESLLPVSKADVLKFDTNESECITENRQRSKGGTSNSLFSRLGLDQILNGTASCSRAEFEDHAAKRRKTGNYSFCDIKEKMEGLANLSDETALPNPVIEVKSEASLKQAGLCAGDSSTKKKKARPGTKPRPKDRQLFQDRLTELRELIPNGEKMSIDRLLERTIRHLNFMQGIKRHAENLKNIDRQKLEAKGKNLSGSGKTWACEISDHNQSMTCPLIVEDLNTPGQMLIEILCEEDGFFLEIANIIREFGLVIIKGVMEVRETKIWAHYIVEAEGNRHVTRHEVFSTLIQLLQMSGQRSNDRSGDPMNAGVGSLFNNSQHDVLFPIHLGHC